MIFPWDCELHKCKDCFAISFIEDLDGTRIQQTYISNPEISTTITEEQLACESPFDIVLEGYMSELNVPSLYEILKIASDFADYYQ